MTLSNRDVLLWKSRLQARPNTKCGQLRATVSVGSTQERFVKSHEKTTQYHNKQAAG